MKLVSNINKMKEIDKIILNKNKHEFKTDSLK